MVSYQRIICENISICWLLPNFAQSARACILLTLHGIINLSFICFPLHPYSTPGKTVVCSSLTFVLVETHSFMIFVKFPLVCSRLFLSWLLHWCSCHWWWEPPKTYSWLLCWYVYHLKRCLFFFTVHITLVFIRFNLWPTFAFLVLTLFISSFISFLISTSASVMVFIFCHLTDTCYNIAYSSCL